ncbi:MAG: tRNA uridine-5-carboxymethylaminomethyl(34) synthesis GTPase MnmE [Desulfococcaceae bacterium]|jgi:tRNA modification GTPase|nr:tRNA uridine-5-carboxymethylaminomethyl(34) synthesis GTPase MnmE [Desulfococcaceae bacterium]
MFGDKDNIAAIATPPGKGGIGIIRISGPDALPLAASLFSKSADPEKKGMKPGDFISHRMYHGYIRTAGGRMVDEVLLVCMKSPRSYTCEDVVEIQAHSGPAVLRKILELLMAKGVRLAEPGEFTRRAFLNGRIDLTRAEAVMDIIEAGSADASEAAAAQVRGDLKQQIEMIREKLLQIQSETAAAIDFPEDTGEEIRTDRILKEIKEHVCPPLETLLQRYEDAHVLREGLRLTIAGKPNVGKSSLMNRLLRKERAIVTPVPGTTRDMIEETLLIRGISIVLTDTAGVHDSDDPVEKIGIERSRERIQQADLILFMTDSGSPVTKEDHAVFSAIGSKPLIWIRNKSDLKNAGAEAEIPKAWAHLPRITISALQNRGTDKLRDLIAETVLRSSGKEKAAGTVIPNLRHKQALEKSLTAVKTAVEGMENELPFELISIDLQDALDFLGEIIGLTVKEDVLDRIFSNFCIGK